jgi:hypothetical protein
VLVPERGIDGDDRARIRSAEKSGDDRRAIGGESRQHLDAGRRGLLSRYSEETSEHGVFGEEDRQAAGRPQARHEFRDAPALVTTRERLVKLTVQDRKRHPGEASFEYRHVGNRQPLRSGIPRRKGVTRGRGHVVSGPGDEGLKQPGQLSRPVSCRRRQRDVGNCRADRMLHDIGPCGADRPPRVRSFLPRERTHPPSAVKPAGSGSVLGRHRFGTHTSKDATSDGRVHGWTLPRFFRWGLTASPQVFPGRGACQAGVPTGRQAPRCRRRLGGYWGAR